MDCLVVSGSNRKISQSERISKIIQKISKEQLSNSSNIFDLYSNNLPLWNEEGSSPTNKKVESIKKLFSQASSFIFVVPEWHGMVPPHVKNLILLLGTKPLWHKPALIVGVSSSNGGAYPAMELRGSSHKNSHICWIPEQIIIRNVKLWEPKKNDEIYERLISYLKVLDTYSKKFKDIREELLQIDIKDFGM